MQKILLSILFPSTCFVCIYVVSEHMWRKRIYFSCIVFPYKKAIIFLVLQGKTIQLKSIWGVRSILWWANISSCAEPPSSNRIPPKYRPYNLSMLQFTPGSPCRVFSRALEVKIVTQIVVGPRGISWIQLGRMNDNFMSDTPLSSSLRWICLVCRMKICQRNNSETARYRMIGGNQTALMPPCHQY